MVSSTDRILPKTTLAPETIEEDEEVEVEPDVKVMEEQSQFNEIMIWGHESLPEDTADPYMKGIEEWISFAEQVCEVSRDRTQLMVLRSIHLTIITRLLE